MNREIKFRVWSKNRNRFLTSDEPTHMIFINKDHEFSYHRLYTYIGYEDDLKIQQFTGLKDTNDKEIYEGDILQYWIDRCVQDNYFIVDDIFQLHIEMNQIDPYYRVDEVLIVGNIYENPELLENGSNKEND